MRATFFVQGRWATAYPHLVKRMLEEEHVVGSHSHFHASMPMFTRAGMENDLALAERAIHEACGEWPAKRFRPPFGHNSMLLDRVAKDNGYETVLWNVASDDWKAPLASHVIGAVQSAKDGDIVLMHTWPDVTVDALPHILENKLVAA